MREIAQREHRLSRRDRAEVFDWMESVGCSRIVVGYHGGDGEYVIKNEEPYDTAGNLLKIFIPRSIHQVIRKPIYIKYGVFAYSGHYVGELSWHSKRQRVLLGGKETRSVHVEQDF